MALETITRKRVEAHQVVERARLVLHAMTYGSIARTARALGSTRKTVRRWVSRWLSGRCVKALRDRQRSGRNKTFDLFATSKVLSIVSQAPAAYGRVTVSWTQQQIVEVLREEGLEMSRSTVQRILARQDIDIRGVRYWLHTPKDRDNFIERRDRICGLYLMFKDLPADEIVICLDAKPGIQMLANPTSRGTQLGPRSGQPRRIEFEYRRMGTRTLVAAVSPATGEVLFYDVYHKERRFDSAATIDCLNAMLRKLRAKGYRRIHLVLDNGPTHVSKATTQYFAENAESFTTYFTPVHASWLNLCENFFSTFSRRYLRHRRYTSVEAFDEALPDWIADHNARCNPLRWTYAPHQRAA